MASSTSISGFSSLNSICSSKSHIHSSLSSSFPLGSLHRQSHGSSVNRNPTFALVLNNNKFQRWRNMVRSVAEETLVPEETDQPVSALAMFFQFQVPEGQLVAAKRERAITGSVRRAEGTMNEAAIRTVTNALEETEGVANLKVQVVEGIASVELTKEMTIQATGVASNLVEIIQEFQIPWGSKIRISSAGNFRIVLRFQILLRQLAQRLQPMLQHPAYAFIKTPVHALVMTSTHVPVKVPTYAPIMVPTLPPAHSPEMAHGHPPVKAPSHAPDMDHDHGHTHHLEKHHYH
ncbi:unnamed protein product [Camellia sinensis]